MAIEVKLEPETDRELVLARLIEATPEAAFRCWTETALIEQWFAPKPFTTKVVANDLRVGGETRVVMTGPNGEQHPAGGVYLEVVPGRRLAFTDAYTAGWTPTPSPFMTAILTFEPQADGRTLYVARARHWTQEAKAQHVAMGFHEGWGLCAQQLEDLARTL